MHRSTARFLMDPQIAWPRFHPCRVINCRERIKSPLARSLPLLLLAQRASRGSPFFSFDKQAINKGKLFFPLRRERSLALLYRVISIIVGERSHFSLCTEKLITLSNYRERVVTSQIAL